MLKPEKCIKCGAPVYTNPLSVETAAFPELHKMCNTCRLGLIQKTVVKCPNDNFYICPNKECCLTDKASLTKTLLTEQEIKKQKEKIPDTKCPVCGSGFSKTDGSDTYAGSCHNRECGFYTGISVKVFELVKDLKKELDSVKSNLSWTNQALKTKTNWHCAKTSTLPCNLVPLAVITSNWTLGTGVYNGDKWDINVSGDVILWTYLPEIKVPGIIKESPEICIKSL